MVIDLLSVDPRPCGVIRTQLSTESTATRRVNVSHALSCMSPWPFLTLQHLLVFSPSSIGILDFLVRP